MPTFCFCSSRLDGEGPIPIVASSFLEADLTVQMSYSPKFETFSNFGLYIKSLGLTRLIAEASIPQQNYNITHSVVSALLTNASISDNINVELYSKSNFSTDSEFIALADKISGNIFEDNIEQLDNDNFFAAPVNGTQKLYPVQDLITSYNGQVLVNEKLQTNDLFNSINGGIFVGDFRSDGRTISDTLSYILPSSINIGGHYRYKAVVENPRLTPKESRLFIRAAAPLFGSNDTDESIPRYTISNIKFEDPSGNLIIQYRDIEVRGDADFDNAPENISYTTYITRPIKNNAILATQDINYPILNSDDDYTLTFDIIIDSNDAPFNLGFNEGFDDDIPNDNVIIDEDDYLSIGSPFSTISQEAINPINSIRISEIEIFNFGAANIVNDTYLNCYTEVDLIGERLERFLSPQILLPYNHNNRIHPSVNTVWASSPDSSGVRAFNTNQELSNQIVGKIINDSDDDYIELVSSSIIDSGKLHLVFTHKTLESLLVYRGGAFRELSNSFSLAELVNLPPINEYFLVDEVYLRVKAKKAIGSRDYAIDVVGYSNDKLLNVTSQIGGFLQNDISGSGSIPYVSGFAPTNSLGLSSESISDKYQYYQRDEQLNVGGDHYRLSPNVVNSTSFKEYKIPLKIYQDIGRLGQPQEYGLSNYFESLYLDIYPLPSGASISSIQLVVKYKPSNGLNMHTMGEPQYNQKNNLRLFPRDVLYPSNNLPLSYIDLIPHAYDMPTTFKQNYSRRWKGAEGISTSSFKQSNFDDFGFERSYLNSPFISSNYEFKDIINNLVIPDKYTSGSGVANHTINKVENIGWRFNSNSLFSEPTPYRTIDWTSISGYETHTLRGKISDSFDCAIRMSGSNSIDFQPFESSGGFATYIRFSPDKDNNFQSGVLFSHYNTSNELLFLVGYSSGYLFAQAKNSSGNFISLYDNTIYSNYSYPLNVVLTYDNNLSTLNLSTKNELDNLPIKIFTANNFTIANGSGSLLLGGFNSFITDFGFSNQCNLLIVDSNSNDKDVGIYRFFDAITNNKAVNHKLSTFIDESLDSWSFGEFRHRDFASSEFSTLSKRDGYDFIYFDIKNDGIPYAQKINTSLASGFSSSNLSYHSQIENDFLRIHLSDAPDNFYAAAVRLSKTLPQGYDFVEDALLVETVLEYTSSGNVIWPNGKTGPKLIVSLYTTNKDPSSYSAKNFGLINRGVHYLDSKDAMVMLQTGFDFDSFVDDSEAWFMFPEEKRITEFNHKYFSKDLDDMFIQYDIEYPSGNPYYSNLRINTVNVSLDSYISKKQNFQTSVDIITNGSQYEFNFLNFVVSPHEENINSLILHVDGCPIYSLDPAYLSTYIAGASGVEDTSLPLYIGAFTESSFGSDGDLFGSLFPNAMDLYISGQYVENEFLVMHTNAPELVKYQINDTLPLIMFDKIGYRNSALTLFIRPEIADELIFKANSTFNLYTEVTQITLFNSYLNLYTTNYPTIYSNDASLNSYIESRYAYDGLKQGKRQFLWNGIDSGLEIEFDDNFYANIPVGNEIRGVELICFGDCSRSGTCVEKGIYTHETQWTEDRCVDGGIFRAKSTYTNPTASGFGNTIGYSGNYYGIRKYTGLVPSAPYFISAKSLTGNDDFNLVPPKFEEWEYGTNDNVAFSGTKIVAPNRIENAQFGYSIATAKNIAVVGAPKETVYDNGSGVDNAGALYVYRRLDEPTLNSGSLSSDKTGWGFEAKLTLPSGYILDYPIPYGTTSPIPGLPIPLTKWNVGQEGRELGTSVAIGVNNDIKSYGENNRQIIVAGGPKAEFTRTFDDITTNKVKACIIVFADEFNPNDDGYWINAYRFDRQISEKTNRNNTLYKYYARPPLQIETKILVIQPTGAFSEIYYNNFRRSNYLYHTTIPRTNNKNYQLNKASTDNTMLSGVINLFLEAFQPNSGIIHNNIPVTVGIFCDNSKSLSRQSVQPLISNFTNWYREYSYASGLKNFYQVPTSGNVYEFFPDFNLAEDWRAMSNIILDNLLDTGRIANSNETFLFAEDFGLDAVNTNLSEFNVLPDLGGRVYIFEKESGYWNVIQEISSTNDVKYNGFGHSVNISDDTLGITIGSPYTNESCYSLRYDDSVKNSIYSNLGNWLNYRGKISLRSQYNQFTGSNYDRGLQIYSFLSPKEKFDYRNDLEFWGGALPEEYKVNFIYSYDNIPYTGGDYKGLVLSQLNTSRLGWSSALNEDGSIIAFGSPTDSLNRFDDTDLWYGGDNNELVFQGMYPAEQYAGSVRVFQSRDYYSHNGVVSFSRFGNIGEENGDLQVLGNIFNGFGGNPLHRKMNFSEIEIPKNAGLAFITTPSLDAASDEIMQNIKDWLALGDRTLVLVGNDPVYENNGLYSNSNDIVNKILSKLDSRMRLHPTKNRYESLIDSGNCASDLVNILPSYQPKGISPTYINFNNTFVGHGVSDIRMHIPEHATMYMPNCNLWNDKCSLPLAHRGDLRANFNYPYIGYRGRIQIGQMNWARLFDKDNKPPYARNWDRAIYNFPKQEPIPLLVAGEYIPSYTIHYPAEPATSGLFPIYRDVTVRLPDLIQNNTQEFWYWDALDSVNYKDQVVFKIDFENGSPTFNGDFFNPDPTNNRDAIIQGRAEIRNFDPVLGFELKYDRQVICSEEIYQTPSESNNNSQVVLLATVLSESKANLTSGSQDINIQFYTNLIAINGEDLAKLKQSTYSCNIPSTIGIVGGWTGRKNFKDGYSESFLEELYGELPETQAEIKVFSETIPNYINVCWIPNTKNAQPSDQDITNLKNWLNLGGKKLIVTFDDSYESALAARNLSNKLGIKIQPIYLENRGRFANSYDRGISDRNTVIGRWISPNISEFNIQSKIIKSCLYDVDNTTNLIVNEFYPRNLFTTGFDPPVSFTPILGNFYHQSLDSIKDVLVAKYPIYDTLFFDIPAIWEIDGVANISIPVIPNSGYTVFINYLSEFENEKIPITIDIDNFKTSASPNDPDDEDVVRGFVTPIGRMSEVQTNIFTGRASSNSISINFRSRNGNLGLLNGNNYVPHTNRILSVSGVLHPIGYYSTTTTRYIPQFAYSREFVKNEWIITYEGRQAYDVVTPPRLRAIMNDNTRYCQDICDYHSAARILPELYRSSPIDPNYYIFYCDRYEIYRGGTNSEDGIFLDEEGGELFSTYSCSNKEIEDGPVVAAHEKEHFSTFINGYNRSNIVLIGDKSLVQGDCTTDVNNVLKTNVINFIRSLYPPNPPQELIDRGGKRFEVQSKIISPERGSNSRYYYASGLNYLISSYGNDDEDRSKYRYNLSKFNPNTVIRREIPDDGQKAAIEEFGGNIFNPWPRWGASGIVIEYDASNNPRIVDYSEYSDAINGGIPRTVSKLGYDFIDIHHNNIAISGFVGDLFGYSISLYKDRLVVGSPFAAFNNQDQTFNWENIQNNPLRSGLTIGNFGGAGAVYVFTNSNSGVDEIGNNMRWELKQKLRPKTINAGQDVTSVALSQNEAILGSNIYSSGFLKEYSISPDKFGSSIDMDGDLLLVGAPCHDFDNLVHNIYKSGEFVRKEFDFQFDIPLHKVYDLGSAQNRQLLPNSGVPILNRGAVFSYENDIINWDTKAQAWTLRQKLVPQGYRSNSQNFSENDMFGNAVAIERVDRKDAKYNAFVTASNHKYGLSSSSGINNAGSIYTYDAMIRNQPPAISSKNMWLDAKIFSDGKNNSNVNMYVNKEIHTRTNQSIISTGLVFSNKDGEIYLEGSGFDGNTYGNISNRPYIYSIYGEMVKGTFIENGIRLFNIGADEFLRKNGSMTLQVVAPETAYVYSTLDLYTDSIISSGVRSLNLFNNAGTVSGINNSLNIYISGQGLLPSTLLLRGQGK